MQNVNAAIVKSKYQKVSELGSRFNLSFSSYLELGDNLIALDGIKRSLLVLKANQGITKSSIIDLNNVAAVIVKKRYGRIGSGELKRKGIGEFLKSIDLHFISKVHKEPDVISFYNSDIDDLTVLPKLETSARNWQVILSKMIK